MENAMAKLAGKREGQAGLHLEVSFRGTLALFSPILLRSSDCRWGKPNDHPDSAHSATATRHWPAASTKPQL